MNHTLVEQLKSQLPLLRAEWKEAAQVRDYALAEMSSLEEDDPEMADVLSEFEASEMRLEEIEDDILDLELQVKEEEKKA